MVSKFRKFDGLTYKLLFSKPTKAEALKEIKLFNTSPSFRIRKYRIVKYKLTMPKKDRAKEFKNLTHVYAVYGIGAAW